ncbi:hypothetical protein ACWEFJ_18920 [Actinosynnema sp. NPDC004786]
MSFSGHARRAGDPTVPLPHRVSSFRSCVRAFPAAPYEDTMRYLELVAGPFQRDARALDAALGLLLLLRARWKAQVATYAAVRRIEKRRGIRRPRHPSAFGPVSEMPLADLHTPRGAERFLRGGGPLPGGEVPRFDGSSFELSTTAAHDPRPSTVLGRGSSRPFGARGSRWSGTFDGSSFHLGADHHTDTPG